MGVYHSNVSVSRVTVWKIRNDPVVQMGWQPRAIHNVHIDTLRVIHARYISASMYVPSAIFGASPLYSPSGGAVQPRSTIALVAKDVECEGIGCPALLRLTPLQSYDVVLRDVVFPDGLAGGCKRLRIGESEVPAAQPAISMALHISNWSIGTQCVTMDNFQSD